jgi:hypothetical protein
MPNAVTPCRIAALERSKPSAARAHSMTMNCSVAPEVDHAARKVLQRVDGVRRQLLQRDPGVGHLEVEERGDGVDHDDDGDGRLGGRIDPRVEDRQVEMQ